MQSKQLVVPFSLAIAGLLIYSQSAHAQVTADVTAGNPGTVAPLPTAAGVIDITGGTVIGPNGNQNLFHSFSQFGLTTGQTANFIVDPGTTNILSRVNGGAPSNINGVLQVTSNTAAQAATANLYIMNPAGVIFGPNASLNVPASFYATTAGGIGFGGQELNGTNTQVYFNAYGANTYANLTGGPTSFSFPDGFTGSVVNLSNNLSVPSGQILGLFGNTVVGGGNINSPGSYVAGVSVPTPRFIKFATPGNPLTFEFPTGSFVGQPFTTGLQPTTLPALITGGAAGATSVRVDAANNVFLVGGGAAGADAAVTPGDLAVRNINVSATPLSATAASSIRLVGGRNVIAGNLTNNIAPNGNIPFGGDVRIISGAFGTTPGGGNAAGTVQVGNVEAPTIDITSGGNFSGGNFTTQGLTPNQPNSITIVNRSGNITTGTLTANNVNLTPTAPNSAGGNIVVTSLGNLTTGAVSNNAGVGAAGATATLPNGGGEVRFTSGGGTDTTSTVTTGNINSALIDINSGSTVTAGDYTTQAFTPGQPTAIRIINRSGNIAAGNLTANNVRLNPAAGASGGGNIVVTSGGNLNAGIISNNAGVGAAGAAANLPNGGGEVVLTSGSPNGAGTVTTSDINSASIDINSGGTVTNRNLFTQGFTMAGRPIAIRVINRSGNVSTNSILANNVNAAGQAAGGGNIVINVPGGAFTATGTVSQLALGSTTGNSLTTSGSTGGAVTGSAVSVGSRGSTTINQLGSAQTKFIQGGNLQVDSNKVIVYRLASNPNIRVLIQGTNADGSLKLVDATTGQAIAGGSNIVIRNATTNRIAATTPGGGTAGLIIRLGDGASATGGTVNGVLGESSLPATSTTGGGTVTPTNQLVVTPTTAVDTQTVIPGVRGIGPIDAPTPTQPTPIEPTTPPEGGNPVTTDNTSLIRRSQDVERSVKSEDAAPVNLALASSVLTADALTSAQQDGVLTQMVERQVAVPVTPLAIPEKKEENPLDKLPKPKSQVKPKLKTIPQLW